MGIYKGDCKVCERRNVLLSDHDDKCMTCRRLDHLEEQLKHTIKLFDDLVTALIKKG